MTELFVCPALTEDFERLESIRAEFRTSLLRGEFPPRKAQGAHDLASFIEEFREYEGRLILGAAFDERLKVSILDGAAELERCLTDDHPDMNEIKLRLAQFKEFVCSDISHPDTQQRRKEVIDHATEAIGGLASAAVNAKAMSVGNLLAATSVVLGLWKAIKAIRKLM